MDLEKDSGERHRRDANTDGSSNNGNGHPPFKEEQDKDPNLVDWAGDDDPENPHVSIFIQLVESNWVFSFNDSL